jgi:hypothetical protein
MAAMAMAEATMVMVALGATPFMMVVGMAAMAAVVNCMVDVVGARRRIL